jgi:exosome complex component CSL4
MAAEAQLPQVAVPGRPLGPTSKYLPGPGTHVHEGNVVASLLGRVRVSQPAKAPGPAKRLTRITAPPPEELPTLSVARDDKKREALPDVGNVVLCKVVRIMPRQAIVSIRQVEGTVLDTEWQGVIRVQDVRATEKDKVKIYESFKPGDVVRAEVVSTAICCGARRASCEGGGY